MGQLIPRCRKASTQSRYVASLLCCLLQMGLLCDAVPLHSGNQGNTSEVTTLVGGMTSLNSENTSTVLNSTVAKEETTVDKTPTTTNTAASSQSSSGSTDGNPLSETASSTVEVSVANASSSTTTGNSTSAEVPSTSELVRQSEQAILDQQETSPPAINTSESVKSRKPRSEETQLDDDIEDWLDEETSSSAADQETTKRRRKKPRTKKRRKTTTKSQYNDDVLSIKEESNQNEHYDEEETNPETYFNDEPAAPERTLRSSERSEDAYESADTGDEKEAERAEKLKLQPEFDSATKESALIDYENQRSFFSHQIRKIKKEQKRLAKLAARTLQLSMSILNVKKIRRFDKPRRPSSELKASKRKEARLLATTREKLRNSIAKSSDFPPAAMDIEHIARTDATTPVEAPNKEMDFRLLPICPMLAKSGDYNSEALTGVDIAVLPVCPMMPKSVVRHVGDADATMAVKPKDGLESGKRASFRRRRIRKKLHGEALQRV